MAKYKQAQFVGFHIRPGARDNLVYMGDAAADTDIQNRCAIMRAAIAQAYKLVKRLTPKPPPKPVAKGVPNNVVADPVLKIFMAPEFFFRGPNGAYPIDKVSTILPELAKETKKQLWGGGYKYEDWLFVLGTAVGYQNPDETITKIVRTWHTAGGTYLEVDNVHSGLQYWDVEEYAKATVTNVEKLPEHRLRLTLGTKERFEQNQTVTFVHGPKAERTATYDIAEVEFDDANDPTKITVEAPSLGVQKDWVAEITGLTAVGSIDVEGDAPFDRTVSEVRELDGDMVEVELTTPEGFVANEHLTQIHPEQGGEFGTFTVSRCGTNAVSGNATITVKNPGQKRTAKCNQCTCEEFHPLPNHPELCSGCTHSHAATPIRARWTLRAVRRGLRLDVNDQFAAGHFIRIRRPQADKRAEVFNFALVQQGGSKAEKELLVYKATYSSIDYLKAPTDGRFLIEGEERRILTPETSATRVSEVSGSGLGGESVFEIGGVTIGMEICLDHREGRLHNYFSGPAAGQAKPQIQLIPSWGMSIGLGPVCCRDNGLIFNVDGQRGESVLRVNDGTWSCDVHRTLVRPNEQYCPTCMQYRCTLNSGCYSTVDGNANHPCPHCGGNTLVQFYECGRGHYANAGGGNCPQCFPAPVPWKPFERKLKRMGPVVQPLGDPETVEMPFFQKLTVWQRTFFQEKGKLVVYPPKPIPGA